jgi:hypothetical protein
MTILLEKAFKELESLPDDLQDKVASLLLEELIDSIKWEESFRNSKDILREMALSAIKDFEDGKTEDDGLGDN